jgi:hypothetical protein
MKASVRSSWVTFNTAFEGMTNWLYLDVRNLVTTGMGNLCDPIISSLNLPWRHGDGGPLATINDIADGWRAVKARVDLAPHGGAAFKSVCDLRLAPADVNNLILSKLNAIENALMARAPFKGYPNWCADAQLGLLSMAWAMGPAFSFPHFEAAASAQDWAVAAGQPGDASSDPALRGEAWMENNHLPGPNPANPGLHPRNLANRVLFFNAARVVAGLDPNALYYPSNLA